MSTISNARRRVKPERRLRLVQAPGANGESGLLRIAIGKEVFLYSIRRLPADFGLAFGLTKVVMRAVADGMWEPATAERYNVLLADDGRDQCECLGHSKLGRCKHTSALWKLRQLGLI
jgi:hypothetical protein